jgi:hypothetical protein
MFKINTVSSLKVEKILTMYDFKILVKLLAQLGSKLIQKSENKKHQN